MRRSQFLSLLALALLLVGGRSARAAGSSLPIVDFGPASSGRCILGIIDDPEPLPTAWSQFHSGSVRVVLNPDGGMYVTMSPSMGCDRTDYLPIVTWETGSRGSRKVVFQALLGGAWSAPSTLTETEEEQGSEPQPLGTVRLSRGSFRAEPNLIPSNPNSRPDVERASKVQSRSHRDGPPAIVNNPVTNVPMVVWTRSFAAGFDILSSHFVNGAWSKARVVAGSRENELDPQLVVGPDGTIHLFYWVAGATARVLHQQADRDLTRWTRPVEISQPGEVACRPAGAFHDGVLYVAYEIHDFGYGHTPRNVVLAREDGDGFVSEVIAVTQNSGRISPRVHSEDGSFWVDWDDGAGAMAWLRGDGRGHWETTRYEPYGIAGGDAPARDGIRSKAVETP